MNIKTIKFSSFSDQRPGTSGLRKAVTHYQQLHYTESFIQSIFTSLGGVSGKAIVVGGDGRYYCDEAVTIVLKMAIAQGAKLVLLGENGLLSTPAASHVIRHYHADFGIILSASHNPGGKDGDFGIKFNLAAGQPAPEYATEAAYEVSKSLTEYTIAEVDLPSLDKIGSYRIGDTEIRVISSTADYADLMETLFDFPAIKAYVAKHPFVFDAMHAATGPYAVEVFANRLGLPQKFLLNTTPLPDFGGGHPDPSPAHIDELKAVIEENSSVVMGAASDGDGDRNLITGRKHFINPCDSLAVIADNHALIPCLKTLKGVGRTMPTSRAVDTVCAARGLKSYETPTGWKFFANLLDADLIHLCGEESFGTGGNHVREKDGIWAVLCWLNLQAATGKTPDEIIEAHWQRYGRHIFNRFDYTGLDKDIAQEMLAQFEVQLGKMIGQTVSGLPITDARQFNYTDPTNGESSPNQGLQIRFGDQARVICRLSGTDTRGATLRMYVEYWQQDTSTAPALTGTTSTLADLAQGIMNMQHYFGRSQPDNIV
ncbi:MAG: alpha-D-glucose phosphate-specific phosphoglucomutase [Cardiobacteriaceae bacterium]|nr:alpha-D-glucose phosphate-specific phosphoglucomutase [Cardiobacteriaceae bacterium]